MDSKLIYLHLSDNTKIEREMFMTTETKKLTKTTEPLDIEMTMQKIKAYLEKPKWTDTILNEERNLFDSPFKALIPAYAKRNDAALSYDLFFIGLFEKIYFANLIKEMKLSATDIINTDFDVSEIHIHQRYKNYAELCRKLNEPDNLKGKQRQNQMKKFKRHFTWRKTGKGNEIEIVQKFSKPKAEPLKNREKSIYIKHLEYLLLAYLYQCKEHTDELSLTDIMIRLGFIKESFKTLENHTIFSSKEREEKDLQEKAAEDFVQDVRSISYGIIYRAIESLKKRRLITCEKVVVIDGTVADLDKQDKIREVELQLFKKFGIKNISQVYMNHDLQSKFYKQRNNTLFEKYGWKHIQSKYQMKSSYADILYGVGMIFSEIKSELNLKIVFRMLEELQNKQKRLQENINFEALPFENMENKKFSNEEKYVIYDLMKDNSSVESEKNYLSKYEDLLCKYVPLIPLRDIDKKVSL